MVKFNMKKLDATIKKATWNEFTLKGGFYYGTNLRGQYVASSLWTCNQCVYIYTRQENGEWKGEWYDFDRYYYLFPVEFRNEVSELLSNEFMYSNY